MNSEWCVMRGERESWLLVETVGVWAMVCEYAHTSGEREQAVGGDCGCVGDVV
jgi:hypothetical protein